MKFEITIVCAAIGSRPAHTRKQKIDSVDGLHKTLTALDNNRYRRVAFIDIIEEA